MTTVGFIGLGQIGAPMASRLVDGSGRLVVFDVVAAATAPFAAKGADVAASVAGVVEAGAEVVSVMVRDDAQVRDVVGQLLAASAGGLVIAVHSTIRARTAEDLAVVAADAGCSLVDAPVSGGFLGAHAGTLAVMVGGDGAAVERCRPVFESFGSLVVHAGPAGAGTRAKIARNLISFVGFAAAAEAQRLAEAAGLSLTDLGAVVRHSDGITGGAGAIMLRGTTEPLGTDDPLRPIMEHTRSLGEKDLSLALELAASLGVDVPLATVAADALAAGLGVPHTATEEST